MNICFSCDRNYLHYLYIAISSIIRSSLNSDVLNFYVLQSDFDNDDKITLDNLVKLSNHKISYLFVDDSDLKRCRRDDYHIPIQTFYRYLIADLEPSLEKVIYLDVDIEVVGSLKELWDVDLEDNFLGAAIDLVMVKDFNHKNKIGLNYDSPYFNAGVMLLNLVQFRKYNLKNRLIESSLKNKNIFQLGDQDALNVICMDNCKYLERRFNYRSTILPGLYDDIHDMDSAVVKHFIGPDKKLFELKKYLTGYPKFRLIIPFLKYFIFKCYFLVRKIKIICTVIIRKVFFFTVSKLFQFLVSLPLTEKFAISVKKWILGNK